MSRIAASSMVLLVLPYLILGNIIDSSRGDCDTLDRDLELKLNQLFSLLPKAYSDTQFGGAKIGTNLLTIGNATITHLNRLEPSSKYQVFCTKDERRIIANLRSDVLEISYPWKVCSGDQGRISTESPMVGLEVVFLVRETDQGRTLMVSRVTPLILEGILVHFIGAGMIPATIFSMAGHLFPGPFRYYWAMVMPEFVKRALMDTLAQMQ
uniref:Putative secreted protein n=1 Tax=Ixodes scapularis TaxID=6945 RepID=A0A4D5S6V4_IXOSC